MRNKSLNALLLVIPVSMLITQVPLWAATARMNPFLTLQEEAFYGQDFSEEITDLKLSGVFFSPGNSYAVIDGKVVREKDRIYDKEVVGINEREVLLKDRSGAEFILRIKNVRGKFETN